MSKHPRVAVSIFLISMIILPAIFILGILLPLVIYNALEVHLTEYKDFFTGLGISFLIVLLIPPWDAKKRAVVSKTFRRLSKSFFKPKHTEDLVFKDTIIHFAAAEDFSNDSNLASEIVENFFETSSFFDVKHLINRCNEKNFTFGRTFQPINCQTMFNKHVYSDFPDFVLDHVKNLKNSSFKLNSNLFFETNCKNTTCIEIICSGGEQRNIHFMYGCSLDVIKNNIRGN